MSAKMSDEEKEKLLLEGLREAFLGGTAEPIRLTPENEDPAKMKALRSIAKAMGASPKTGPPQSRLIH